MMKTNSKMKTKMSKRMKKLKWLKMKREEKKATSNRQWRKAERVEYQ